MSLDFQLRCEHCNSNLFSASVTHNLREMAIAAELYDVLWHGSDVDGTRGVDCIAPIDAGIARLVSDPERYKKYNPENGWGNYDGLVRFATEVLIACRQFPNAIVVCDV